MPPFLRPGPVESSSSSFRGANVPRRHGDFARIRELQTEYYQRVRAIVRKSPPETVALLNVQLVGWEVTPP